MKISTAAAAKRVNSPSTSMMPPTSSVQPDQRSPEHAGRIAELFEQCGIGGEAHAAECAEQLLHPVRNEYAAERDPQDRLRELAQ